MATVANIREPETASAADVPHVFVAINAVMEEIAQTGISKDRNNSQQNYRFRGIDDVYNALAPILAKHKLIITPRGRGRTCEERQSKSGGALFYVTVEMEYELTSASDGSSIVAGPMYGEAMDAADKATNKAQSAAYKYMAMQQFCIPTEGDNDADGQTHDPMARPSALQMAVNLLRGCGNGMLFKQAWEANIEGWKGVLSPPDQKQLLAVKQELVAKFTREAEEAKAREAKATQQALPPQTDPFDDEIPL